MLCFSPGFYGFSEYGVLVNTSSFVVYLRLVLNCDVA